MTIKLTHARAARTHNRSTDRPRSRSTSRFAPARPAATTTTVRSSMHIYRVHPNAPPATTTKALNGRCRLVIGNDVVVFVVAVSSSSSVAVVTVVDRARLVSRQRSADSVEPQRSRRSYLLYFRTRIPTNPSRTHITYTFSNLRFVDALNTASSTPSQRTKSGQHGQQQAVSRTNRGSAAECRRRRWRRQQHE